MKFTNPAFLSTGLSIVNGSIKLTDCQGSSNLRATWLYRVLVILICTAQICVGQGQRAAIRGLIEDNSKLPVPKAQVLAVNEETGESNTTLTNATGEFIFATLPVGSFRLEVERPGYKKYVSRFNLSVNQDLRLTVSLEIGSLQESVVVSAPNVPVRKDSISLGTVIQNAQVSNLPLDGRNFLELSLLLPGAVPAAPGSASSVRGDFSFSVSGSREGTNTFLLDGMSNVDPKLNTLGIQPPVDAIREFEMLTSTPDASFGRNSGSQVNVVMKSGTNAIHGTVYEFVRNGALDARNYFAPPSEPAPGYERNQFGASLGGPIKTNRTFFFVDYEGTRSLAGITRISNVPTLQERAGDFSQSLFPKPIDPYTQQPFPDGIIPAYRQSPIGQAIAALYPTPNRTKFGENFVSSPDSTNRVDQFDARIDQQIGRQSSLTFRYSFGDGYLYEPFSGSGFATVPGFGTNIPRRAQNLVVTETHTFSPTLLNEARFGFGRTALGSFQENLGTSINQAVGLPELSNNPRDWGLSFISVTGYSPLGDEYNNPQHSVANTYTASDNLTWARGRHLFKMGGDFHVIQQNAYRDIQSRGLITFSSSVPITGNALADMLLGYPIFSGGAEINNAQHLRTNGFSLYFQDTYQLRSNLTLLMGIRYEHNSPPYDAYNLASLYDPATQSIINLSTAIMPRAGRYPDWNDWAPRIGIAWTPRQNGSLVVRAGYGIYYDQFALAPGEGIYFNPPYYNLNFYFPLPGLPLTLDDPFPEFFPYQSPPSAQAIQRNLQTPYVQQWNLNIQKELGRRQVLEVAYVGSKGTKLYAGRDINQPPPSPSPYNPRPVLSFADINELESRASSTYHSLQVRFQQNLEYGLSVLAAYTYSRSIDDASDFFTSTGDANYPQNSYDLRAERARSNFDLGQRFSCGFSYYFPIGKGHNLWADRGWLTHVVSGWQTLGIVSLQTGRPFTVALLPEIDNSNTGRSSLGFGANDRPNVLGDPKAGGRTLNQWFNTSAFGFPPYGSFGNSGRNILTGPGYQNVNLSLLKNIQITESKSLQFRFEFFNFLNHPNFDLPDIFLGSPTFGSILSAQSPRHIQFGVKFIF